MDDQVYQRIQRIFRDCKHKEHYVKSCRETFPEISDATFLSIYSQSYQQLMKRELPKYRKPEVMEELHQRYCQSTSQEKSLLIDQANEESLQDIPGQDILWGRLVLGILLTSELQQRNTSILDCVEFALEMMAQFAPCLLCFTQESFLRSMQKVVGMVVKGGQATQGSHEKVTTGVSGVVSQWMKEPQRITPSHLRQQVISCVESDTEYGPLGDNIKHSLGMEHEHFLAMWLKQHSIRYLDEGELRKRNYDKTPDFKLECPIIVLGTVVHWIESKAMFGDVATHNAHLDKQLRSYVNRFGPGMVVYWHGHHKDVAVENGIIIQNSIFDCEMSNIYYYKS